MSHLCQLVLTADLLFAGHELKTPSKRNLLRKKLSHHIGFSSLEFLYGCNCHTITVIKLLPAQPHLSTTQNQGLPFEKSKDTLKQRKGTYAVKMQTVPRLAFPIPASQMLHMSEQMRQLQILIYSAWGGA